MEEQNRQYVIGMAGHIDHGKTALIKALTGINTDRLKEEQERGITIDLGFAHLSKNVTIIDVPGHERLIKNMVAGVSTIDLVLFVVAADDGIMPQTREHLDIVTLLGIQNGVFVITKVDLVDREWLLLVEEEIRDLLRNTAFNSLTLEQIPQYRGTVMSTIRRLSLLPLGVPGREVGLGLRLSCLGRALGLSSLTGLSVRDVSHNPGVLCGPYKDRLRVQGHFLAVCGRRKGPSS